MIGSRRKRRVPDIRQRILTRNLAFAGLMSDLRIIHHSLLDPIKTTLPGYGAAAELIIVCCNALSFDMAFPAKGEGHKRAVQNQSI